MNKLRLIPQKSLHCRPTNDSSQKAIPFEALLSQTPGSMRIETVVMIAHLHWTKANANTKFFATTE